MSYQSFDEVREEIRTKFFAAFSGASTVQLGYVPEVFFDDLPTNDEGQPNNGQGYGILQASVENEQQDAISSCVLEEGKRRFLVNGIVMFHFYLPKTLNGYESKLTKILEAVKAEFKKANSGSLWFRNATAKNLAADSLLSAGKVVCEFQYNEVN